MNTLSRAVTAQFFPSPDSYNALQLHWSSLMRSDRRHTLSATHHLLYQALRGKDWRKGFTCATNQRKLDNGAFNGWGLFRALHALQRATAEAYLLAPFDGLVTPEMLGALRVFLPRGIQNALMPYGLHGHNLHLQQFADGAFPFEAYVDPETNSTITFTQGNIHG